MENQIPLRTYLHNVLENGKVVRWKDSMMPIRVYVAPFKWYQKNKQLEAPEYMGLVYKALKVWSEATNNKVRFHLVQDINQSQMDISWRRVDRKSLGDCKYAIKDSFVYSAEITIGISDGIIHAGYQHMGEVEHTILHEIGHGIGLKDHSPYPEDIMYVPHQYGVTSLSERDTKTVKWLYEFPPGFSPDMKIQEAGLASGSTIDDLILKIENPEYSSETPTQEKFTIPTVQPHEADLATQQELLAQRGKYFLSLQSVKIPNHFPVGEKKMRKKPPGHY